MAHFRSGADRYQLVINVDEDVLVDDRPTDAVSSRWPGLAPEPPSPRVRRIDGGVPAISSGDLVVLVLMRSVVKRRPRRCPGVRTTQVFRRDGVRRVRLHRHADPLDRRPLVAGDGHHCGRR